MKYGVVGNPAYDIVHVQGSAGDGLEPDYNMENNPLYEMRIKSNERHSHKTETAAGAGVYENLTMWLFEEEKNNQQVFFLILCFTSIHLCLQTGIIINA